MGSDLVLLTVEEAAAKLKIHPKTLYRNREIPRVELSDGTIRWIESELDSFIRSKITRKPKAQKRARLAVMRSSRDTR